MITISLCMIVRDEEKVLRRCLSSIKDAVDEIIIVDTGSTDATKEIAGEFTGKIFDFEWIDDFSAARNFAFSKATSDYQMWLDADDVFPQKSREQLIALKDTLCPSTDIVTMKYVLSTDASGNPTFASTRERLFKRENDVRWQDPVHEFIQMKGNIFYSDIAILHAKPPGTDTGDRNLQIYTRHEGTNPFTPRQMYYFARELKDHGMYAKAVYYFERFLQEGGGWVEDNIGACHALATCYKKLDEMKKILPVLLRSFEYGAPRAEIVCEIGYFYKWLRQFEIAAKWFKIAAHLGIPQTTGFVLLDCWQFIPNIEACCCLCEAGHFSEAEIYNEAAAKFKPDSESVRINREFIKSRLVTPLPVAV